MNSILLRASSFHNHVRKQTYYMAFCSSRGNFNVIVPKYYKRQRRNKRKGKRKGLRKKNLKKGKKE
jgi:hypothetical protein